MIYSINTNACGQGNLTEGERTIARRYLRRRRFGCEPIRICLPTLLRAGSWSIHLASTLYPSVYPGLSQRIRTGISYTPHLQGPEGLSHHPGIQTTRVRGYHCAVVIKMVQWIHRHNTGPDVVKLVNKVLINFGQAIWYT